MYIRRIVLFQVLDTEMKYIRYRCSKKLQCGSEFPCLALWKDLCKEIEPRIQFTFDVSGTRLDERT